MSKTTGESTTRHLAVIKYNGRIYNAYTASVYHTLVSEKLYAILQEYINYMLLQFYIDYMLLYSSNNEQSSSSSLSEPCVCARASKYLCARACV